MTGTEMAAWRQACGATLDQLAAELGVHRSTVMRLERMPTLPRLYHLALAVVASIWNRPLPERPE